MQNIAKFAIKLSSEKKETAESPELTVPWNNLAFVIVQKFEDFLN